MSEVKWYCRGELGEYILDQVESVLMGLLPVKPFGSRWIVKVFLPMRSVT